MRSSARVAVLALGTFAIGTDGFVIAGVLPGIAHGLHATLAETGLLVTAFAVAYAVGAPLLTTATTRSERRPRSSRSTPQPSTSASPPAPPSEAASCPTSAPRGSASPQPPSNSSRSQS